MVLNCQLTNGPGENGILEWWNDGIGIGQDSKDYVSVERRFSIS